MSAISCVHKVYNVQDPCSSFYVRQIIKGTARCQNVSRPRLRPISKTILQEMLSILPTLYSSTCDCVVYQALLKTSYYCCLRAVEAVVSNCDTHTLTLDKVKLDSAAGEVSIRFTSYKHCQHSSAVYVIHALPHDVFCPVKMLKSYYAVRPSLPGPVFLRSDGTPIHRQMYFDMIKLCTTALGLNPALYNTHSLRIGRATDLAKKECPQKLSNRLEGGRALPTLNILGSTTSTCQTCNVHFLFHSFLMGVQSYIPRRTMVRMVPPYSVVPSFCLFGR